MKGKKVKTWYGRFRQDIQTPSGVVRKQRRVRLGTLAELPTKNDARRKLAEILGAPPSTEMTFNELVDRWKTGTGRTYRPSTLAHYTNALEVRHSHIRNATDLNHQLRRHLHVLIDAGRRLFQVHDSQHEDRACHHVGITPLGTNGSRPTRPLASSCRSNCCEDNLVERHVLSAQQITNLVSVLSEPYSTLVSFIAETGVRIGEAAGIRPEDFDGDFIHIQRRIYNGEVGPLKTKKSDRWLPVSRGTQTTHAGDCRENGSSARGRVGQSMTATVYGATSIRPANGSTSRCRAGTIYGTR